MRIEVGDELFTRLQNERKLGEVVILFNGEPIQNNCYMADEELGIVRVPKLNAEGHVFTENNISIAEETISGVVVIQIPK